jgi:NAD(P)-dependent dehydrogenase (short-subunit alcohol dehydrogenase family)
MRLRKWRQCRHDIHVKWSTEGGFTVCMYRFANVVYICDAKRTRPYKRRMLVSCMLTLPHTTVVFGAGGGIGRATALAFAKVGATVWAVDVNTDAVNETVKQLDGQHHHASVNVSNINAVQHLAETIWKGQKVDSVIYAPGLVFTANVADLEFTHYKQLMSVNLDGAFYVAQAFVKKMLEQKRSGSFVFLSSMAGKRGEAGASAYCASKFGLLGMVQSFAAEVAVRNIRVNAVCPGNVNTPMLRKVAEDIATNTGRNPQDIWQEMANIAAAKRLVEPEEIAQTCLWLCSPGASAITGEAINVDAGALSG